MILNGWELFAINMLPRIIIEDHLIEVCAGVDAHVGGLDDLCGDGDAFWRQANLRQIKRLKEVTIQLTMYERCTLLWGGLTNKYRLTSVSHLVVEGGPSLVPRLM